MYLRNNVFVKVMRGKYGCSWLAYLRA